MVLGRVKTKFEWADRRLVSSFPEDCSRLARLEGSHWSIRPPAHDSREEFLHDSSSSNELLSVDDSLYLTFINPVWDRGFWLNVFSFLPLIISNTQQEKTSDVKLNRFTQSINFFHGQSCKFSPPPHGHKCWSPVPGNSHGAAFDTSN
jgi:hypothetical protein